MAFASTSLANMWTKDELLDEWKLTYETRLGILCGTNPPTPEQDKIARDEANAVYDALAKEP